MKRSLFLLPIFLLFTIYTNTLFCSADESLPPAVVDTAGRFVATGNNFYYMRPANNSGKYRAGGVGLRGIAGNMSSSSCPLCVIQEIIELRDGLAMSFYPVVKPEDGIVRINTDMNIEFGFPDTCNQPTVWRLQKSNGTKFVNLGGEIGNPGIQTLSNWFRIEKIGDERPLKYKIVYCPLVCSYCYVRCKNVGLVMENGKRRLALAKKPLEMVFLKE